MREETPISPVIAVLLIAIVCLLFIVGLIVTINGKQQHTPYCTYNHKQIVNFGDSITVGDLKLVCTKPNAANSHYQFSYLNGKQIVED